MLKEYGKFIVVLMLLASGGATFGQISSCEIVQQYATLENFAGEGGDVSLDGSVMYGRIVKTGEIKLWNSKTGRLIRILRPDGDSFATLSDTQLNSNGSIIAARLKKRKTVWIGKTLSKEKLSEFATAPFTNSSTMLLSPSGDVLFTGDFHKGAALWDVAQGRLISLLTHPSLEYSPGERYNFSQAAFSPDGNVIAVAFYAHIYVWNARTGAFIKRLYTSSQENGKTVLFSNRSSIYALRFSPDGSLLASGGRDHTTQLWEVESGQLRTSLPQGDRVFNVVFSLDGHLLATVSYDHRNTKVWDTGSGKLLYTIKGDRSGPFSITFSKPDIGLIAIPVKNTVEFRDAASGSLVKTCRGVFGYFLPGGETFIAGLKPSGLGLFNVSNQR